MATITVKKNPHWGGDWKPYLLTINGEAKGNIYDNKSLSVEMPEGTHKVCLRADGTDEFSTTIEVKDKPLLIQVDTNNSVFLIRLLLAVLVVVLIFFNFPIWVELGIILLSAIYYFYSRKQAFYLHLA